MCDYCKENVLLDEAVHAVWQDEELWPGVRVPVVMHPQCAEKRNASPKGNGEPTP